jgi:hypothetical protein
LEEIFMKYFEKCKCSKGKIFASFSLFACLRHPQALLTVAMFIAALFLASCKSPDDIPPPPPDGPKLSITSTSKYVLPGDSVKFTVQKMIAGSEPTDVTSAAWKISGKELAGSITISNGFLTVAKGATAGNLTVEANYDGKSVKTTVKVVALPDKNTNTTSIKEKFGIDKVEKAAVTETFNALHEFVQAGGLTNDKTKNMIELGDWIDLEDGLKVSRYHREGRAEANDTDGKPNDSANGAISLVYNATDNPQLLRLIVVGINSFHSGRGVTTDPTPQATTNGGGATGQYNVKVNDSTQHLVFQFKNIPGRHRINADTDGTTDRYEASEMREYLVPVIKENTELAKSGHFLDGLLTAGVPKNVLWGPTRYVATVGKGNKLEDCAPLNDLLWLPTRFEMFGSSENKSGEPNNIIMLSENAENQARLEYYLTDGKRSKQGGTADKYYLSSARVNNVDGIQFNAVKTDGKASSSAGRNRNGVAPAFCVW